MVLPPRLLPAHAPDLLLEDPVRLQVLLPHLHELLRVVLLLRVPLVARASQ